MSRLLLALVVTAALAGPAAAQVPPDGDVVDPASGLRVLEVIESDEPFASLDLGEDLIRGLNRPWTEVGAALVPPDSGGVAEGAGRLSWRVPDFAVDLFSAEVRRGRLHRVTLDFSPDGPDFGAYAEKLRSRHGPPAADGFYAASALRAPFDIAVRPDDRALDFRASGDQTVAPDLVLPVQFRIADPTKEDEPPVDNSPIVDLPTTPPEIAGGLAALVQNAAYPAEALADSVAGTVLVQAVVNRDGSPTDVTVLRSPDARLSAAATEAVRRTWFEPALLDGEPVRARIVVPVRFRP